MTCEERRVLSDPAEQERRNEEWAWRQGVKKCPSCKVLIEKIDGCNHVSCKCGAHICWWCMGVFGADKIYEHMNLTHGGIDGEAPRAEDMGEGGFRAQQEALMRFQQQARPANAPVDRLGPMP